MDERVDRVAELLHEAAELHHATYRVTDGADDDWASWYSDWLTSLSELPAIVGGSVVRSELTYLLVKLAKEHDERASEEPWERFYARGILTHLAPP